MVISTFLMLAKRGRNYDSPIRGLHNYKRTKKMVIEAPKLLHNLHRIYPKCSAYVEETMKCVEESSHEQTNKTPMNLESCEH